MLSGRLILISSLQILSILAHEPAHASFSLARPSKGSRAAAREPQCKPGQPDRSHYLKMALQLRGDLARDSLAGKAGNFQARYLQNLKEMCSFSSTDIAATPEQIDQWIEMNDRVAKKNAKVLVADLRKRVESELRSGAASSETVRDLSFAMFDADYSTQQVNAEMAKVYTRSRQSEAAAKKSCGKPVNLSAGFGPSRNQDSVGWCFAFASADLLSYKMKKKISAADVALSYFNQEKSALKRWWSGKKQSEYEGGFEWDALEAASNKGLCLESKFNSEDNGLNQMSGALDRIQAIKNSWSKYVSGACEQDLRTVRALFPQMSLGDVNHAILTSTQSSFVSKLATEACEPREQVKVAIKITTAFGPDKSSLFTEIDTQLNAQNPSAIEMKSAILKDSMATYSGGNHSVMAIGRRFNERSGQCEYLIRNSWGPGKFTHDPIYERDDKGHVWIPKEKLNDSVYASVHI